MCIPFRLLNHNLRDGKMLKMNPTSFPTLRQKWILILAQDDSRQGLWGSVLNFSSWFSSSLFYKHLPNILCNGPVREPKWFKNVSSVLACKDIGFTVTFSYMYASYVSSRVSCLLVCLLLVCWSSFFKPSLFYLFIYSASLEFPPPL